MSEFIPEDLVAGEPVISVRWRLHKCALPLKSRHLHAFESRGLGLFGGRQQGPSVG